MATAREGGSRVDQVAAAIHAATQISTEVGSLIDQVKAGSAEQACGIEEESRAVSEMQRVTESAAANAEQNSAASEEMSAQSRQMLGVVDNPMALVGGHA
jgi:methyl-accepting chemotaxis protein